MKNSYRSDKIRLLKFKQMIKYIFLTLALVITFNSISGDYHHGKSEREQVTEYITTAYSYNEVVNIRNLTTDINQGKANFQFVRISKFNDYVTCENVNGTLSYHNRKYGNKNIIQVDRIESKSKSCNFFNPLLS
ncbi:hypothetical protein [Xenorhabdus bovienii]|uniref:hypothetical protein n=1 Tax=Xenorhabdus bovienii TaxID=40576 RepID=UPI0021582867|nr:hypothetical protein [Xenorhabdus bovienii]